MTLEKSTSSNCGSIDVLSTVRRALLLAVTSAEKYAIYYREIAAVDFQIPFTLLPFQQIAEQQHDKNKLCYSEGHDFESKSHLYFS